MVPVKCGHWEHFPTRGQGGINAQLLIKLLVGRIGKPCPVNRYWCHFVRPNGWWWARDQNDLPLLVDNRGYIRAAIVQRGETPQAKALPLHIVYIDQTMFGEYTLLVGKVKRQQTDEVLCWTYRFLHSSDVEGEVDRFLGDTRTFAGAVVPNSVHPIDSWDAVAAN